MRLMRLSSCKLYRWTGDDSILLGFWNKISLTTWAKLSSYPSTRWFIGLLLVYEPFDLHQVYGAHISLLQMVGSIHSCLVVRWASPTIGFLEFFFTGGGWAQSSGGRIQKENWCSHIPSKPNIPRYVTKTPNKNHLKTPPKKHFAIISISLTLSLHPDFFYCFWFP